jgi:hypothetical protein
VEDSVAKGKEGGDIGVFEGDSVTAVWGEGGEVGPEGIGGREYRFDGVLC